MIVVPAQPLPAQVLRCILGGQACKIVIFQKSTGVFVDLYAADQLIVAGALALTGNKLVRSEYLAFSGDIGFVDTTPDEAPLSEPEMVYYTGIGSRYLLVYVP